MAVMLFVVHFREFVRSTIPEVCRADVCCGPSTPLVRTQMCPQVKSNQSNVPAQAIVFFIIGLAQGLSLTFVFINGFIAVMVANVRGAV